MEEVCEVLWPSETRSPHVMPCMAMVTAQCKFLWKGRHQSEEAKVDGFSHGWISVVQMMALLKPKQNGLLSRTADMPDSSSRTRDMFEDWFENSRLTKSPFSTPVAFPRFLFISSFFSSRNNPHHFRKNMSF
ncbi:MAG: hypothetical protein Q9169_000937 [Polycauliona sp. 2 TL-2023]